MMPAMIQGLVNRELDAGIFLDGYEMAVTPNPLNHEEGNILLETVIEANPKTRIDIEKLSQVIERVLPQCEFPAKSWLVEKESFVMTDGLSVAKFQGTNVLWCTSRISIDGIILKEIKENILYGFCWLASEAYKPDVPFRIDLENGNILSKEVVDFFNF